MTADLDSKKTTSFKRFGLNWLSNQKLQYLGDGAHSFGTSFPEHKLLITVQVLGGLDEAKVDCGLIPCPETVFIH